MFGRSAIENSHRSPLRRPADYRNTRVYYDDAGPRVVATEYETQHHRITDLVDHTYDNSANSNTYASYPNLELLSSGMQFLTFDDNDDNSQCMHNSNNKYSYDVDTNVVDCVDAPNDDKKDCTNNMQDSVTSQTTQTAQRTVDLYYDEEPQPPKSIKDTITSDVPLKFVDFDNIGCNRTTKKTTEEIDTALEDILKTQRVCDCESLSKTVAEMKTQIKTLEQSQILMTSCIRMLKNQVISIKSTDELERATTREDIVSLKESVDALLKALNSK